MRRVTIKRSKLNLIIDALLLLVLAAMAGMGLLMKYVLLPGFQRWEVYKKNVELYLWGMDRHEWGTIHLALGCVFLGLLVLHIALHWGAIVAIYRCLIPNRVVRVVVALVLVALVVLLATFSALIAPEVREVGRGGGHGWRGGRGQQERTTPPVRDVQ
ncbi:MAG: DUF4405 domain-containing protein [Planctomycetota bacterium]